MMYNENKLINLHNTSRVIFKKEVKHVFIATITQLQYVLCIDYGVIINEYPIRLYKMNIFYLKIRSEWNENNLHWRGSMREGGERGDGIFQRLFYSVKNKFYYTTLFNSKKRPWILLSNLYS